MTASCLATADLSDDACCCVASSCCRSFATTASGPSRRKLSASDGVKTFVDAVDDAADAASPAALGEDAAETALATGDGDRYVCGGCDGDDDGAVKGGSGDTGGDSRSGNWIVLRSDAVTGCDGEGDNGAVVTVLAEAGCFCFFFWLGLRNCMAL